MTNYILFKGKYQTIGFSLLSASYSSFIIVQILLFVTSSVIAFWAGISGSCLLRRSNSFPLRGAQIKSIDELFSKKPVTRTGHFEKYARRESNPQPND